jgi:hypothetical protein
VWKVNPNRDGEFPASPIQGEEVVQGEIASTGGLHHHQRGQWVDANHQGNTIPFSTYNLPK